MRKKELFDFTNITPKLFTELRVADKTVLQSFNFDEKNHQIYTTQVASGLGKDNTQSYRITRLSLEGLQLDSMLLKHGGHGTNMMKILKNFSDSRICLSIIGLHLLLI
ncbi:hypothetical protein NRS6110_00546 [Bacillus subtilis]|nr:putative major teichoic acid biosynthesis protein [Bacillus subtilis]TDO86976.1 hypothetical protein BDW29_2820 [Bacillus sp. AtDRG31]CAF1731059.1 hypothetical protein NRS6111_00491 [Bacillus subtilis]CAF1731653.1 hypothetical protein NRS6110_00546 [Bacillus subtilis]CAF1748006.1 hypothetical protein NRS6108_01615 [Bacillus subtilis]